MKETLAVILAGGKGQRLGKLTEDIPKPLVKIHEKPVLEWQIENLKKSGIHNIILVVGHKKEQIKTYFQHGEAFDVEIDYFEEEFPLGTAGSFYYLQKKLPDSFLVIYGDLIFDFNFISFINFHLRRQALCTLAIHPNDHPYDSDVIVSDHLGKVTNLLRKNVPRDQFYSNSVNAGILMLEKSVLQDLKENSKQDLEKDVIFPLIPTEKVYGYKTVEYIRDMGTPERFQNVQVHLASGVVASRRASQKRSAIFLDRDGTINRHVGLVIRPEDLIIEENAHAALEMINHSGYLAIVITNQSVVARNLCTEEGLKQIHQKMEGDLGQRGAYIDDLFYCPHHPDQGYPEEKKEYKIECKCRKPKIGLIQQAAKKYNIDLSRSYFIGDSLTDVETGKKAGVKTILLRDKLDEIDPSPDYFASNLYDAVKIIINQIEEIYATI